MKAKCVVLIPLGPGCKEEFVKDSLESVRFYMPDAQVVLVDDGHKGLGENVIDGEMVLLKTEKNNGKASGLYFTLCEGMRYAVENFEFDVLLRIDTDGLVIGSGAEMKAGRYFKKHPQVGILGSYRKAYDGAVRDYSAAGETVKRECSWKGVVRDRFGFARARCLRDLVSRGKAHGYELGEHVMGGACFYSYELVKAYYDAGYLPLDALRGSWLEEDMIFGLLARSLGFELGEFNGGTYPMGVKWQGLPDNPDQLIKDKKCIVHSIRYYEDMDEKVIRKVFARARKLGSA